MVPALAIWSRWALGGSGSVVTAIGLAVAAAGVAGGLWRADRVARREALRVAAFALVFGGLCYRWIAATAQVDGYGEGLYDLHYLAGAMVADAFPATDLWHPGSPVDHYYSFGFDALAVYARALGLTPGAAYALSLALLPWAIAVNLFMLMGGGWLRRAVAAVTGTFAASGLSLVVGGRLVDLPPHALGYAHTRLLDLTEWAAQPLAHRFESTGAYPIESPAGLVFELGDLHPPLFGFYLLSLWLLLAYRAGPRLRVAGMGALIAPAYVANAWALPFFAAIGAGFALLIARWRLLPWLGLGLVVAAVLVAPWLAVMVPGGDLVSVAWLPEERRSALATWIMVWLPQLLAMLVLLRRTERLAVPFLFVCVLIGLEFVLLDDAYGGDFERFNGVLKLGSLALMGWTASLLIAASAEGRRHWARAWGVIAVLAVPAALQLHDVSRAARAVAPVNTTLDAAALLRRDDHRALYAALAALPRGLVLEQVERSAYAEAPMVATLLGWPAATGWWAHLEQVRELDAEGANRQRQYQTFYTARHWNGFGALPPPDYVLVDHDLGWRSRDVARRGRSLRGYAFVEVARRADGVVAGYFRRL